MTEIFVADKRHAVQKEQKTFPPKNAEGTEIRRKKL
jgi:hypothetical protein